MIECLISVIAVVGTQCFTSLIYSQVRNVLSLGSRSRWGLLSPGSLCPNNLYFDDIFGCLSICLYNGDNVGL